MLKIPEIEYIRRLYHIEGVPLRKIARILGKNFRTVQKYAYMENWNPDQPLRMGRKQAGEGSAVSGQIHVSAAGIAQGEEISAQAGDAGLPVRK